jgi:hypothetical protein
VAATPPDPTRRPSRHRSRPRPASPSPSESAQALPPGIELPPVLVGSASELTGPAPLVAPPITDPLSAGQPPSVAPSLQGTPGTGETGAVLSARTPGLAGTPVPGRSLGLPVAVGSALFLGVGTAVLRVARRVRRVR